MHKTLIDLNTYKRKDHFEYFNSLLNPHIGVSVEVDVTDLKDYCKKHDYSFYLVFVHAVCLALNSIAEFRQRIIDKQIVEYDECATSHTEMSEDGTYCYCTLYHNMDFNEYIEYAKKQRKQCLIENSIEEDEDVDGMYFVSCLPWVKYTSLLQPTNGNKNDSNPRITWGKYELNNNNRLMMPVSILCHHGLVDGYNIGQFYDALNNEMNNIINHE